MAWEDCLLQVHATAIVQIAQEKKKHKRTRKSPPAERLHGSPPSAMLD
jgi:hypothetical protein